MSKYISELLGASEPMFGMAVSQLEQASGNPSADVRLTAEIVGKAHMKMRELGLDPSDTTGRELYGALMNLVARHDEFLAKRLGGDNPDNVADMLARIKLVVDRLGIPKRAWVIKHSVAKRLLKKTPPKRLMKLLGYRSIDSMLKRESVDELYGALRLVESPQWLNNFLGTYWQLTPSDFESRDIQIVLLDSKKWNKVTNEFTQHHKHNNITHLKEMGVILMLPMPIKKLSGVTITVMPLILHYINEIRLYSSFFKLQQVRPEFGSMIVRTLVADPNDYAVLAGQPIHWRVIQRYFGKQHVNHHPEIFEPHVQPEDLHWRKAEEILYRLEPALHFWHDMDYVGLLYRGEPISFNLMDLAVSYVNKLDYGQRAVYHFRQSLWNEVLTRYLGQRNLEVQVIKQLDNEMIEPELFAASPRSLE